MLKLLTLFILFVSFLNASDKVEIYASSMESEDNTVKAYGGVTVVYKDYFLSAEEAVYDKNSSDLELFKNIRATYGKEYKLLGDYAKLNLANKERTFKPFFMLEKTSEVWMSADEGYAKDTDLNIDSGVMSGCNPNDPLWKMEFTSSNYNTDTKWLNLYNARIYIYDIPVIYTPYFGYSLDTTRRTGLLIPAFGISDAEGFYYEQPIYIAEQNWWDLQLKPQVRTNRGYGGYSEFRFIDSAISKGTLTAGYFKEKESYSLENELAHDSHYGFNFEYDNKDLLNQWFGTSLEGQSGLYIDINNMNDVDYINLSTNDSTQNATATQILSRANLFYNTDKDYFGAYFKHYKDLTKQSNENTLQKLPTFQYHSYLDTFFNNHLLYNVDIQSNNIYREINKKAIQTNLDIPVTLQTSVFDEYLNLSYKAQLFGQHSNFHGDEEIYSGDYRSGIFARNYHVLKASTQLTKAYEELTHVVGFGARYTSEGSEYSSGYYKDYNDFCADTINKSTPQCEFYNITSVNEGLQLDFTQYIYDASGNQKIYHRLAQNIGYNSSESEIGELENELDYQINHSVNFYNNILYNYDEHSFSKTFNRISYIANGFNISFSHLYKDTFLPSSDTYSPFTSYITSSASYTFNEHYSYGAKWNHDLQTSLKKSSEIGFMYKKRCWDFGLRYVENNRPVLTNNNSSSVYDRYLYFSIVLKPLMKQGGAASDFAARLPETLQGK
ncbi:LPS assembly protein LptD [bacterium]|nr:LPS assembly protein LptD [bacterium]MBU1989451.1 LPS assembly protein LptD [bacterium]